MGGASVPVSITVPGQNASVTFAGTAGHRVSFNFTMSMSTRITVLRPDGATLVSQVAPGNTFIDVLPLPLTGTYTILLDPFDQATGPITTSVYDVPPDVFATFFGLVAEVVEEVCGEAWTPAMAAAWRQTLADLDHYVAHPYELVR